MATDPRPAPRRGVTMALLAVLIIFSAGMFAMGGFTLYEQQTGTPATATVLSCEANRDEQTTTYDCFGEWTIDGRVQAGHVNGVGPDDLGQDVAVTVKGDRAYTSPTTGPVLLGGGVLFGALAGILIWKMRKTARVPATAPDATASGSMGVH